MRTSLRAACIALLLPLFSLTAQADCCDYFLVMHDSYGDGWNGADLQVKINGVTLGTYSAEGSVSQITFTLCDGDAVQLIYSTGDWEGENSYQLFGTAGNVVFSDGPDPAGGAVFTGTGDCDATVEPGEAPCTALPIDTIDCVTVDNSMATGSGIGTGCANYQGGDLWFAMPVPTSGNMSVQTSDAGGLNDTGLALWTGSTCIGLTQQGCDDDSGAGTYSMVTADELPQGEMLYIQVYGYGGGTGTFQLCATDLGTVQLVSSELPLVIIDTQGQQISDGEKIDALMQIKYNGPGSITYLDGPANEYDGHVGIKVRGATSSGYPQKPYGFETRTDLGENNDVSILGMPEENDWVLLSNYNDRSLMRNQISFHLAQSMGDYAPRSFLCEVMLDSNYRGIYLLGEKIKRDNGRVHISKLEPEETTGDDLTGGYILSQNLWNYDDSFESNYSPIDHPGFDVHFLYEYPKPDEIVPEQKNYIASYVDSLETALYSSDFTDPENGYRKYLDVHSFIDYFLVNELARNGDGFKKSVFFHKDKASNGGKFKAGPVWDFDWAWKNIYGCVTDGLDGSGWAHHVNDCPTDNYSCGWYIRLLQDSAFADELRCTYEYYRTNIMDTTEIFAYMDSIADRVQNAQARHFQKWPIVGVSGPAPEIGNVASTYAAEVDTLKGWITRRLDWLDVNIPGICLGQGIHEVPATLPVACYPNPATGRTTLELPPGAAQVELTDMTGKVVLRRSSSGGSEVLDLRGIAAGSYVVVVRSEGAVGTAQLLVQ